MSGCKLTGQRYYTWFLVCISLGSPVAFSGCAPGGANQEEQRGPGRRPQNLALTPDQEFEAGGQAYLKVLSEERGHILPADHPQSVRCRSIGAKLVRAAGIEPLQREINLRLRRYRFDWQVNVVQAPNINAFCLPGGRMIVYTGILTIAQNDDQLATVLGHEIAHALAHHASERIARDEQGRASYFRGKYYDRQQESEADHIGIFLMAFAGYNPEEAVRFWQRMAQHSGPGGKIPEFLSDHPSGAHRIHDLEAWVPKVIAGKKAFDEGRIAPASNR